MKHSFFFNPAAVIVLMLFAFFAYFSSVSAVSYFSMTGEWGRNEAKTFVPKSANNSNSGTKQYGETSEVVFKKNLTKASKVSIKGDFNGWKEENLERKQNGVWEIRKTLSPGKYSYVYVADGTEQLEDFSELFTFTNGRKVSVIEIK